MNYTEMQDKAKELGLPYVGVKRGELEASIVAKTGVPIESTEPQNINPAEGTPPIEPVISAPAQPEEPKLTKEEKKAQKETEKAEAKRIKDEEAAQKAAEEEEKRVSEEKALAEQKEKEKLAAAENIPVNYEVEVPEDANTAEIWEGQRKVRTFSLANHGEEFAELAKTYVRRNPKLKIQFIDKQSSLLCPNCGSKISCSKCGIELS